MKKAEKEVGEIGLVGAWRTAWSWHGDVGWLSSNQALHAWRWSMVICVKVRAGSKDFNSCGEQKLETHPNTLFSRGTHQFWVMGRDGNGVGRGRRMWSSSPPHMVVALPCPDPAPRCRANYLAPSPSLGASWGPAPPSPWYNFIYINKSFATII